MRLILTFGLMALGAMSPALAQEESLIAAFKDAKPILNTRIRYENVGQDGFDKDANALTLRVRAGFETAPLFNLKLLLEFEGTEALSGDYNSTTNGNTTFPIVADPEISELNRAQIQFTGLNKTRVTIGRQRINLGTQRFIGAVGFRQNEQTMDAITVSNTAIKNTTLFYGYVDKVHRILGDDHPAGNFNTKAHMFNASYVGLPGSKVTAYGYLLNIRENAALSNKTFGARYDGKYKIDNGLTTILAAEYAVQNEYGDNLNDFSLNFYSLEAGVKYKTFTVKVGQEVLEGNGSFGFATPLATVHKFQGFADAFLATPEDGVKDFNAMASYVVPGKGPFGGLKIVGWYHDFKGENASIDMGEEFDFLISKKLPGGFSVALKYADYNGHGFRASRQKLWLTLGFNY